MSQSDSEAPQLGSVAAPATAPVARSGAWMVASWVGLLVLALLLAWSWYAGRQQLDQVREEIARRLQASELEMRETRVMAKEAQEAVREWQSRLTMLEGRIAESQSQQVALQQMYRELSSGRDEWVLAEVEQSLVLASQQLQLAGNVQGALLALQTADARLARSDRPQFIPLRKIINRDLDRLKALPNVDLAGFTLRLDQVIRGVEQMPLLADGRPQPAASPASETASFLARWSGLLWSEIKQLIRIQRLDSSDQGLLSPEQSAYLRENLKLRLLHARIALLQRNEAVFRADIKTAIGWLNRYFDRQQASVEAAIGTLNELVGATVDIELPTLAEGLASVRGLKAAADPGR